MLDILRLSKSAGAPSAWVSRRLPVILARAQDDAQRGPIGSPKI